MVARGRSAGSVLYRDKSAFLFARARAAPARAACRRTMGCSMSTVQTLRSLKPSEYPLAQPYRIKVVQATETPSSSNYAKNVPVEKYQKEELELLNGLYPKGKLQPGAVHQGGGVRP